MYRKMIDLPKGTTGIRPMDPAEIPACVRVIRDSFATVAAEFGITPENGPRFTAFAVTEERLQWQYREEGRVMTVAEWHGEGDFAGQRELAGYYSLQKLAPAVWELSNLAVLPAFRHFGIGAALLEDAFAQVRQSGGSLVRIGIVEENRRLRAWYEKAGFRHTGTQKFDFFPFTCGYMEKTIG